LLIAEEARRRMTFQKMKVIGHVINVNCAAIKTAAVVMAAMSF